MRIPFLETDMVQEILKSDKENSVMAEEILGEIRSAYDGKVPQEYSLDRIKTAVDEFFMEAGR